MKKGELIAEFAKRTEMSGAAANAAVNTIIEIITERLKKGDTVGITGFGTFSVAKRAARKGRNPCHRRSDQDRCLEVAHVLGWRDPEGCGQPDKKK